MEPEIMVHDMILITNVDEVELQKGDIITFQAYIPELDDYSYVTHYLADIEDNGNEVIYKTQGANKEDKPSSTIIEMAASSTPTTSKANR